MSDPNLTIQEDGGDVEFSGGDLVVGNGLTSAAVLSLFGGNLRDDGLERGELEQYWGNVLDTGPAEKLRSETQFLLTTLPATSGNLLRLQDAIVRDLAWMVPELVEGYSVEVGLIGVKRISIELDMTVSGETYQLQFTREWTGNA